MSHNLHIGLVGPLPPPAGGMATQTNQLMELLRGEGIEVSFVQTNSAYQPGFVARLRGVRALFRLLPYLLAVWKLAGRTQLIHLMANSGWSWQLFAAPVVWIGWLRKTPVIVNYRGGDARNYLERSFSRVAYTMRRAHKVVVPSAFLQRVFADFGIAADIVPNIIDLQRFSPLPVVSKKSHEVTLIITRNLEPIYGIETAIKAIASIKDVVPEIKLRIAGSGMQRKVLEQLVLELGLQNFVSFEGRLNSEQIVELYHSADIMVNPTTVDNMPNSVLESLACGVPVVTTNVGGIPYIVEHNKTALLVPPDDPQIMAQEIIRLLEDKELQRLLIDNGKVTVQPLSWLSVRNDWLDIYRTAAAEQ